MIIPQSKWILQGLFGGGKHTSCPLLVEAAWPGEEVAGCFLRGVAAWTQVVQPEDSESRFFPGGGSMRWHAESKDETMRVKCNDSHPINGLVAMNGLGVQDRVMGVTSHKSGKEREQRGSSSHHPSGRWRRHGLRRRWLRISLLRRGRHALLGRRRLCHSPWGCLRGGRHASCRGERV